MWHCQYIQTDVRFKQVHHSGSIYPKKLVKSFESRNLQEFIKIEDSFKSISRIKCGISRILAADSRDTKSDSRDTFESAPGC